MKTETCFRPGDLVTSESGARARVASVINWPTYSRVVLEPIQKPEKPEEPELPPIPEGWVYAGRGPFASTQDKRLETYSLRALADDGTWDPGQWAGMDPHSHYIVKLGSPEALELGLSEPKSNFTSLKPRDRVVGTRGELGTVAYVGKANLCVRWDGRSNYEDYFRDYPDGVPLLRDSSPTLAGLAPVEDDTVSRVLEAMQPLAELIADFRKEVRP